MHEIILSSIPRASSYIENSRDLVRELDGKKLDNTFTLSSFDVVSLFTNVPIDLAIKSLCKRWNFIKIYTKIPKEDFLSPVKMVLSSTYFAFNNRYYKQTFGTPMGSPLSPIIADIVLQDLEDNALKSLDYYIPFYYRYVDDILIAIVLPVR